LLLVRARRDHACTSAECNSTITRFVWDGDQILAEIRGDASEQWMSTELENDKPVAGGQYGRVLYVHAGGIDAPLAIIRMGDTDVGEAILPIANWRGTFVTGTDVTGRKLCDAPAAGNPCEVTWPGGYSSAFYTRGLPLARVQWWGSLASGQEDASGTIYMRNRYYNPQTGAFTQQDPIGLAGGLNTYGFANGDPVTYSDPYGLSACPEEAGGDGRTDSYEDCEPGTSGWYANRLAKDEGDPIVNSVGGTLAACSESLACQGVLLAASLGASALEGLAARATVVGSRLWPAPGAGRVVVGGLEYSAHALERMAPRGLLQAGKVIESRGIPPSVVEHAVQHGVRTAGRDGAIVHTFENVQVVTNAARNRVVTVMTTGH
jgi:RHS repeat-associated protein